MGWREVSGGGPACTGTGMHWHWHAPACTGTGEKLGLAVLRCTCKRIREGRAGRHGSAALLRRGGLCADRRRGRRLDGWRLHSRVSHALKMIPRSICGSVCVSCSMPLCKTQTLPLCDGCSKRPHVTGYRQGSPGGNSWQSYPLKPSSSPKCVAFMHALQL